MARVIKVGIIGCGGIATGKHMPSLAKVKDCEMVAFCDIIPERAESAAKKFGTPDAKDPQCRVLACIVGRRGYYAAAEIARRERLFDCDIPRGYTVERLLDRSIPQGCIPHCTRIEYRYRTFNYIWFGQGVAKARSSAAQLAYASRNREAHLACRTAHIRRDATRTGVVYA